MRSRSSAAIPTEAFDEEIGRFRRFLAGQGLRMTRERLAILAAVLESTDHFDVEELYSRLRTRDRRVSRATVYRTLHLLVESGLVDRARFGSDSFSYEQIGGRGHHDHMVCNDCGRVIEFVSDEIELLQKAACAEHNFVPETRRLTVFGRCGSCARRARDD